MRLIRATGFWAIWLLIAAGAGIAQTAVPEARFVITRDMDFYGADLEALFDTDLDSCLRQCSADPACVAFTFNARSNACFPKRAITDRRAYAGAISATRVATDPAVLAMAGNRAADLAFLGADSLAEAGRAVQDLGLRHPAGGLTTDEALAGARAALASGDTDLALARVGLALSLTDRADLWSEYARLLLARDGTRSERRKAARAALGAAANAYLRGSATGARIAALSTLARALERVGRGRDAIPALRLAQSMQDRSDIAAALDDAIAKYGFRVVETNVESDAAAPRICVRFSEPLDRMTDYAPFVGLDDPRLAVTGEGNALCVDGVAHGERYRLTLRKGLPAASGETLWKPVEITQYVRDRSPSARFPGRAYVLARGDGANLPVETVNLTRLDLSLARVSDRNLVRAMQEDLLARPMSQWQLDRFETDLAQIVWTGSADVPSALNRDMTSRLPMAQALNGQGPGIYVLTARIPGADPYDTPAAAQWFVLTDLGLSAMAGSDGLHVDVRALSDASPRTGVTVELISRANAVLGRVATGADGHVVFDPGLSRGQGAGAPAMIVARSDDDMAFLSLTDPAFDLSDRGVAGRADPGPVDVFLATDRGAYRAGETIRATALARDRQVQAIPGLPLTAILRRPDGVEHSRQVSSDGPAGGHVFALPLGDSVPRGTWTLAIHLDPKAPALAQTRLLVEDFLPERIDFGLSLPSPSIRTGEVADLEVAARYLFGAPGADLGIDGDVLVAPAAALAGWDGYRFGRHDLPLDPVRGIFGGQRTDAAGRARIPVDIPPLAEADRPLSATFTVRVADGAARPVERDLTVPVTPAGPVIGLNPRFDDVVPQGGTAGFDVIALDPALRVMDMEVRWTLNRVETRYQWYQLYGNWNWEPVERRTRIATGTASPGTLAAAIDVPVDWGHYELVVERTDGPYIAASLGFDAGWYAPADAAATPDRLELSLDRDSYAPGDTARLRVLAPAAGTALVAVLSDGVIDRQAVEVPAGDSLIPLAVTDEWGTGAYVTATVLRANDEDSGQPESRAPARALGVVHAAIDPGPKALSVRLIAPDIARPRATSRIGIEVDGVTAEETAYVTLAAVDLGILTLTGFDTPDPAGHYFGQRRLGVEIRDLYGRLIDGRTGALGRVRSGGDGGNGLTRKSPPPTQDLLALFSGPVPVDDRGRAIVDLDLPAFNGTVRLVALAWSPTGVGGSSADMVVRDPVVATLSGPRFLAPGDQSRLLLELVHADGPAGDLAVRIDAPGLRLGDVPDTVRLDPGGTRRLAVDVIAGPVGDHRVTLTITPEGGKPLTRVQTLAVRRNDPVIARTRRFSLAPGESFAFNDDVYTGLLPGTASALISSGPLARFDVPGLLAGLDRYPYGCTEQVTSRALPLLYLSSVAQTLGIGAPADLSARIDAGIASVLDRQAPNGAFGLWAPQSGEFWLDAYVTDFLSRARAAGHAVPAIAFDLALDNLRNRVNFSPDFDEGGEDIAYALYVLAREGRAAMADLRYYADVKAPAFATPLALAQLGGALAAYGDQLRADALFARAGARLANPDVPGDDWRADFGSNRRDTAGVLYLASAAGSTAVDRDALAARLAATGGRPSTQEAAWTLLAAEALIDAPEVAGLLVDGNPVDGPFVRLRRAGPDGAVVITAAQGRDVDLTLTTLGVPKVAPPAGGSGYVIQRSYYSMDGSPADPDSWQVGERRVTVLRINPAETIGARLIIDDPLPAGIEIDNPSLLRSGDISALDWLSPSLVEHAEFRTDRFVAAVNSRGGAPVTLAYVARAVSPGAFHHPAASVEDMYRPDRRARTGTGRVSVAP
ncbi:MAG: alpha-2-macroglobulin family protein [Marinibacterium sp.]